MTEGALIQAWLRTQQGFTRDAYRNDLAIFSQVAHGRKTTIRALTPAQLREIRDELLRYGRPSTVRRRFAALRSFVRYAIGAGERYDPSVLVMSIDITPEDTAGRDFGRAAARQLTVEDVRSVIRACDRGCDRRMIRTLWICGISAQEAAALRKSALHKAAGGRKIRLDVAGRHFEVPYGLGRALLECLPRLSARADNRSDIFPTSARQIARIVRAAGERAGIKGLRPSDLRDAHRRHALEEGCPIGVVLATLGDAMPATKAGRQLRDHGAAQPSSSALYLGKHDVP